MFETGFDVEWGDCDAAGIVYYPKYFDWFDRTFQNWLRSRSMSQRTLADEFGIIGTPLVDVGARFLAPVTFDEQIRVAAEMAPWQEKRMRIEYRVSLRGATVAEGHEVRAWVARAADGRLKGLVIPQSFRDRMQ